MTDDELGAVLDQLIAGWENEVVEFKEATDNFSTSEIGKYFSALANEANLRGTGSAWLVFGVSNRNRQVVGTDYRLETERLQKLKMQIADDSEPSTTFREIHELEHADGRVLLLEIPPAPRGIPIAWKGHYYARAGESLVPLALDKLDQIRRQTIDRDWTAAIVPEATFDDLDEEAIAAARDGFAKKHANRIPADEIAEWPLPTFTDRARLTSNGQITRAALLLVGKRESAWRLSPHMAQLTWNGRRKTDYLRRRR